MRRFLMLQALGCELPAAQHAQCEAYLRLCPERDLKRIADAVRDWDTLTRVIRP